MNLNNERNNIDKIFENHKPKIVEKDHVEKFYDGLIEDWGRGIWEFADWKYKDLVAASNAAETLSALGIEQDDDMMGELRNEISKREESGQTEEVEETTLATAAEPTTSVATSGPGSSNIPPMKETILATAQQSISRGRPNSAQVKNVHPPKSEAEKGLIVNASYYEYGRYVEDIPHGELDKQVELSDKDLEGFEIRPEDKDKVFYAYPEDMPTRGDRYPKKAFAVGSMIKEMKKLKGEK